MLPFIAVSAEDGCENRLLCLSSGARFDLRLRVFVRMWLNSVGGVAAGCKWLKVAPVLCASCRVDDEIRALGEKAQAEKRLREQAEQQAGSFQLRCQTLATALQRSEEVGRLATERFSTAKLEVTKLTHALRATSESEGALRLEKDKLERLWKASHTLKHYLPRGSYIMCSKCSAMCGARSNSLIRVLR